MMFSVSIIMFPLFLLSCIKSTILSIISLMIITWYDEQCLQPPYAPVDTSTTPASGSGIKLLLEQSAPYLHTNGTTNHLFFPLT